MPGALVGLGAGVGLVLVAHRWPPTRRPRLADRLGIHSPRPPVDGREPLTPFGTVERLVWPSLVTGARRLDAIVGGTGSVRRRLDRLGGRVDVETFRMQQLLWGVAGLLGGLVLVTFLAATRGGIAPIPGALLALCGALAGVLARDRHLSQQVRNREQRMMTELPTVAELLALSVAAGESASSALERLARRGQGELTYEIGRALRAARTGAPLTVALQQVADRTGSAPVARFVTGIVIAIERGTPLAEVLRAQAVDAREAGRRALIETGARREIAMMVPVVFLVLPITVIFALFPGFHGLSLTAP